MEKQWSLSELYKSFDSPQIEKDFETLHQEIKQATVLATTLVKTPEDGARTLASLIDVLNGMEDLLERLYAFGSLTYSVDTSNQQASKLVERVQGLLPSITLITTKIQLFLKNINDVQVLIDANPVLEDYRFFLEENKRHAEHMLSEGEELLLAELSNTGSSAWNRLQNKIVSSLTGTFRGKEETLTVLRSKAYDPDPSVRKEAYEAELAAYRKKDSESAACLNAIKGEVITVAKKRGYDSPLYMTLESSRMDYETLDAMIIAIKEYLPELRRYLKKKAELLGHSNGLPFYDLFAPVGEVDMRYSYEEARDFVVKQFSAFSEKLGQYGQYAFDNDWIDPFPREGKVAGAFCSNLHSIKESRIMSNFVGSFNDVTTLAHELGHGYHGDCLKDAKTLNTEYPMPLAETASIFCETIVFNAALQDSTDEEKLVVLENNLMGATQVIIDIYSRYLFETALFEKRQTGSLSVDELNAIMIEAQKEAYGDALDPDYLHPYMWMCKPHYYYASSNFYNFPYAFGQLFALGLYALYQKDPVSFLPKYDALLLATGCNRIHDVLKIVDIDSHTPDFFRASLEIIKKDVEQFVALDPKLSNSL